MAKRQSKIWTEVKSQQIVIQLARFQGKHSFNTVRGLTHFWTIGMPRMAWCGRAFHRINHDTPTETVRVCNQCLESFQRELTTVSKNDLVVAKAEGAWERITEDQSAQLPQDLPEGKVTND